jgi:hypothetical protein
MVIAASFQKIGFKQIEIKKVLTKKKKKAVVIENNILSKYECIIIH